ncbi:hypothetical protein JD844_002257 [Phrynosoma platyrhinos]|uniref:Dephospho-CoA kinase domain-containing protein n=1 Tax=Phrynosoma platyrhinos TaxID=52577 RepID=A0ABQ7TBQ4_PHRPL|nr:hypothetical protein JD844_002257 [Phrynosoma platyrhinos]
MFLVGLTGGIASGKSTVVAILQELGCAVIDADVIARQVVQPCFRAHQRIVHSFGPEILLESGEINREALGSIIFSQPEKRQLLNSITHPEIQKEMLKQILKYFLLGHSDPQSQLSRLMRRNGLTQAEAEARIAAQLPLDQKVKLANHIIDNSGDAEATRRQVLKLHAALEDSLDFLWVRLLALAATAGVGSLVYLLLRQLVS